MSLLHTSCNFQFDIINDGEYLVNSDMQNLRHLSIMWSIMQFFSGSLAVSFFLFCSFHSFLSPMQAADCRNWPKVHPDQVT